LGIYWAFVGHLLGIYWAFIGHLLGIYWAFVGHLLAFYLTLKQIQIDFPLINFKDNLKACKLDSRPQ